MTLNPPDPLPSSYGREAAAPDELGMVWFDWQRESGAETPAQAVLVEAPSEGAARLLGASGASELRGRALRSLFAEDSWTEIEAELAHLGELPPRTLPVELCAAAGMRVRARARLIALGDPRAAG